MIEFVPRPSPAGHVFDLAVVKGAVNAADVQAFAAMAQPRTLVLNVFNGWDGDLPAVKAAFEGAHVVSLDLFGGRGLDVTELSHFGHLQHLRVAGQVSGHLDLDAFPRLSSLGAGQVVKGKAGLKVHWGACKRLSSLAGSWAVLPTMDQLANMPALSTLQSVRPSCEPESLQALAHLRSLDFSLWGKLVTIRQLSGLFDRLQELSLYAASKLQDHQGLSEFQQLRKFCLHKCPSLRSGCVFAGMKSLECLHLLDTKVEDGDLSCLLGLPRLKDLACVDQANLSPSRDELYAHFDCA